MNNPLIAYLASQPEYFKEEIKGLSYIRYEDLFVLNEIPKKQPVWQKNIWYNPRLVPFSSISDLQKTLKAIQRNWHPYLWSFYRRGALVQGGLPKLTWKPIRFGEIVKDHHLGAWTLVEDKLALISSQTSSLVPNGEWFFEEDRLNPPSRAYLKLWEALTRFEVYPKKGAMCMDLGACPGGWTWVLRKLDCQVLAVDRSPLTDILMKDEGVTFLQKNAFSIEDEDIKKMDWVFSDVICYPEKLYEFLIKKLVDVPNLILTIKFQGENHDPHIIQKFLDIPKSRILHLCANKHEVTWGRFQ